MSVRVLLVDDSPLFIEAIQLALRRDPEIEIAGVAANGHEAIELAAKTRPDVITMDVLMPLLGGIEAIRKIMSVAPAPILVLTSIAEGGPDDAVTLDALRAGAVDLWLKPKTIPPSPQEALALAKHVKLLAGVAVVARPDRSQRAAKKPPARARSIARTIGIVASTGGPKAMATIAAALPRSLAASVLVVQHLPPGFLGSFAEWLARISELQVRVAKEGDRLEAGTIYLAPDGAHLTVRPRTRAISLSRTAEVDGAKPSGTVLFESLAILDGVHAAGLVLSGMGNDGARGLVELHRRGGTALVQDPAEAVIGGMPRAALEQVPSAQIVTVAGVAKQLAELAGPRGGR